MEEWFSDNSELITWMTIGSIVLGVASIIIVVIVLVRLPKDYFVEDKRGSVERKHRKGNLALRIARNVLGWLLILAGLAMLILPGQGVLVLLIGIVLAEFPGKYRLERWIVGRKRVQKTINWVRKKFDRPPLEPPQGRGSASAPQQQHAPAPKEQPSAG